MKYKMHNVLESTYNANHKKEGHRSSALVNSFSPNTLQFTWYLEGILFYDQFQHN